jgi:hypothetical protein
MANSEGYVISMETSAYFTCGLLVIVLLYALLKVWRGTKAAFLNYILGLLLTSNLSYIIYIALYNDRHRLEECGFLETNNCYS